MDVNGPIVDRQATCFALFDAELRRVLKKLLHTTDLAPFADDPLALQDDRLNRLLGYFRRLATAGKLAALRLDDFDSYGLAVLSGSRSAAAEILPDHRFDSYAAVCQFILARQIERYLADSDQGVAQ